MGAAVARDLTDEKERAEDKKDFHDVASARYFSLFI